MLKSLVNDIFIRHGELWHNIFNAKSKKKDFKTLVGNETVLHTMTF